VTYLQFHLIFILPPLLCLGWLAARGGGFSTRGLSAWLFLCAIAFVYTAPWDAYLVRLGVWGYPEGAVLETYRGVPLEEYAFFILQTTLTGLWFAWLLSRPENRGPLTTDPSPRDRRRRWWAVPMWAYLGAVGLYALQFEQGTYLGLILVWAAPVLLLHWLVGGHWLGARARFLIKAILPPTLYLWVADWVAIQVGVWYIEPALSLGPSLLGLPLEEAVFFAVTNLMVVQGLFLYLAVLEKAPEIRADVLRLLHPRTREGRPAHVRH
jgi:lycopene cyclase domain-containing protein